MKALIIGLGAIGRRHVDNIQNQHRDIQFIFLRKGKFPSGYNPSNVHLVSHIDDALAFHPDFAVIATPSSLHMEVIPALLQANIPIYIEKPIVTCSEDVQWLQGFLRKGGGIPPIIVGCNLRFLPSLLQLRAIIRGGQLGSLVRASLQAGQWLPDWRPGQNYRENYSAKAELGGGVIFDLIHEIDMARWLFGEFEEVRSLGGKFSRLEITSEDSACILLGNKGRGPVVSISLDYVSRRPVRCYEVVGDEGTIRWNLHARILELDTVDGKETIDSGPDGFNIDYTYCVAMEHFLHCVQQHVTTSVDLHEGLNSIQLALKAKAGLT